MKNSVQKKTSLYASLILLQSLVYGLGNPLTKVAYESITPFWLLGIRFTIASLVFLLFFGRHILRQLKKTPAKDYLPAAFSMALAYIACNVSLSLTTATKVGFMMTLSVVLAPLLGSLLLKKAYPLRLLPLQFLALIGVLLLYGGTGRFTFGLGDWLSLLMAILLAASLVFGEHTLKHIDAIAVSATQSVITALISLLLAFLFDDLNILGKIEYRAWGVILYLALFCTCLAYFLQNYALVYLQANTVAILQCTQPIFTAFIAFLLLGEQMNGTALFGAILIVLSIVLENRLQ
ncbi:drug/metabolite transporter (DMT)-like permease [Lachnospiraceae bacterium PF1-22]|uniref:DMT family transporter n=1 Tax=Ohessyouella blattaphilus TaxID=2949333 RepID=UPI003E198D22